MKHRPPVRAIAALSLLAAACSDGQGASVASGAPADCFNRTSDSIGGPFSLTSHTGATMTEADFKGRTTLVFFGFTYCPDVCPATLYSIGSALSQLPEGVEHPVTALISVDPERDTPDALTAYIASNGFPAEIVGLTGPEADLRAVSKAFAAPFERVDDEESAAGYLMNHSSILYLMDRDWKLATFFTPNTPPKDIAACIAAIESR